MKIGILQCSQTAENLVADHGSFFDMFKTLLAGNGFEFVEYMAIEDEFPNSADDCDGWLVTGSAHGAYDDLPWISRLEEFVRQAYSRNVPIAGICFGHQVMAQALGGRVEKYSGGWGIGHTRYRMAADGSNLELLALHQDQVMEVPPDAQVIATTQFCKNAGLAYRGSAISFQPHPEFTPEFIRDLIRHKMANGLPREVGEKALASIGEEYDSAKIAVQLAQFYKNAGERRQAAE